MTTLKTLRLTLLPLLAAMPLAAQHEPAQVPSPDIGIANLEARRQAQLKNAASIKAFHEFTFTDRQPESGITFRNLITDDNRKAFKANHYDHSNGLLAADVDGDGRPDLFFLSQLGSNELWRNKGDGTFENVTEAAGVALADRVSVTGAFGDYDNDGDPDLFVTTVKMGNVLFENDGSGRFADVTDRAGVAGTMGHSSGSFFFDYDNDGLLDLFVTNVGVYTTDVKGPGGYWVGREDAFNGHLFPDRTELCLLYRNLGDGRFREVSHEVGLVDGNWAGDGAFTDLDGDRYPEVYVLNMQGDDHYWVNGAAAGGGRRFTERTAEFFPRTPWGAMGIKFFDYDNNGTLDLYLTDMHSDMSREVGPDEENLKSVIVWSDEEHLQGGANNVFGNAFYKNHGDGRFTEASDPLGVENYWPWGFSAGDLNADGYDDLFVASSMSFPYRYGINSLFLNERGARFRDSQFVLGIEPRREGRTHIPWFDLDCAVDVEHPLCQSRDGQYTVMGTLGTRSSVVLDIEGDGDLDIVTNEFYWVPQVLVSDLSEKRAVRYLVIDLVGKTSNRDGLGALVKVVTSTATYTRYNDGKSGYLSQSSLPLYFGLDGAETVQRIEVRWPSGKDQTVSSGIVMNGLNEIAEP